MWLHSSLARKTTPHNPSYDFTELFLPVTSLPAAALGGAFEPIVNLEYIFVIPGVNTRNIDLEYFCPTRHAY
jgi:hypothetical protein